MYFWMYVKFNYENKLDLYVCMYQAVNMYKIWW